MALRDEIERVLNSANAESGSNTPDFILAEYLMDALAAFDKAVWRREMLKGRPSPLKAGTGDCPYCHKPAGSYECQRSHP